MNFQRRRFVICIYALFLILSVTINICIFGAKANDSMLCPLQYENLECYSDNQGKIVTLQRGGGQTIIGSSKDGDPITYGWEYDFSKKCENSIYLFKNHEGGSEEEPLKKLDVAVYSISKHEIYCEKTLDVTVSDPKKCAVLKGGNVCVVSSKFCKNMFVCKCTPKGKMKVHRFKSDIESISASPDGTLLYAKLADENKVIACGNTSFKEVDVIETEDHIEPYFLHEDIFVDADGGTYKKNEEGFVQFVKLNIFDDNICFGDPYLIYASASDKINFVDVTSREEYASMKVDGEIVHLAVCSDRNKNTLFTYVVKRDGQLFHNKMKIDDAIEKISLVASEMKEVTLMNRQEASSEEAASEIDDEVMDKESNGTEAGVNAETEMHTKDITHEDETSVDQKISEEIVNLVTDNEVKQSLEDVKAQIDQKEIEQSLEKIASQQMQEQVLVVDKSSESAEVVEQPDIVPVSDGEELHKHSAEEKDLQEFPDSEVAAALDAVQAQVAHNEIVEKLDAVAENAAKDSEIFVSQPTIDEISADDVEIKEEKKDMTDQTEKKQASEGNEEITEKKVRDALEDVQAQIDQKEIEQSLEKIALQQMQEQVLDVDTSSESAVVAEQPEPVQVTDGKELYEHLEEEKVLEKALLNEVQTVIENLQAQAEHNEIEEKLDAVAGKSQCDDEKSAQIFQVPSFNTTDVLPSAQMSMVEKRWKPLKVTQGLVDSTKYKVPKDKKKKIESRIISRKASGKVVSTVSQDKQIPNVDVSELHQMVAADLSDKDTLANSTEVRQKKRIKLHIPKQGKAEHKASQSEKSVDNKKSEGVKRNIRAPQGPKRKRARLMSRKDGVSLVVPAISEVEYAKECDGLNTLAQDKTKRNGSQSKQIDVLKNPEGMKRNMRLSRGPKRKRARLMLRKDDVSLTVPTMSVGEFSQEAVSVPQQVDSMECIDENAQECISHEDECIDNCNDHEVDKPKLSPKGVFKLEQSSLLKGRSRKKASKNSASSKSVVSKLKQNSLQKGMLRKSASERSIISKDLIPQVSVQKSIGRVLSKKDSTSCKKRIRFRDMRERIYRSKVYNLDLRKNFIRGVDIETSFSQFKKNIDLGDEVNVIFKKKGKPLTNGRIGTNTIMEFDTEDMGITTLTAVVPGDLTGSGKTNKSSLKTMCRHIFREKMLEGAYFEAGDINGDGVVDTLDLLLLSKMIEERS